MGFTSYSRPIEPSVAISTPDWVEPMNLDLYSKVLQQKQQTAEKNLEFVSSAYNSLFSIDAEGPDKKKLMEIEDEFRNNMNSLNLSDLSSMETASQLRGIIGKFSTNKDLLSISSRNAFRKQEEEKIQKAQDKGRTYTNRNYDRLMKYYSGEDYFQNPTGFSLSSGYLTPDIKKKQDIITKANTKQTSALGADGRILTYNKVDGDKAQQQWAYTINNDPELKRYYTDLFEDQYEGTDWDQKGKEVIQQALQTSLEIAKNSTGATKQEYEEKAARLQKALDSNYAGSTYKNLAFQQFIDDDADDYGNSINSLDVKDIKADQIYLTGIRNQQQREMAAYREGLRRETKQMEREAEGLKLSKDPIRTDRLKKASAKGIPIVDPNSPDGYISNEELDRLGIKGPETAKDLKDVVFTETNLKDAFKTNPEAFVKALENLGLSPVSGFDESDIEGLSSDDGKIYTLNIDKAGPDWGEDEIKLSKQDLYNLIQEVKSQSVEESMSEDEEESTTETPSTETFDKSKLDAKTLKALKDNMAANPGVSEYEIAKAMGLIQ